MTKIAVTNLGSTNTAAQEFYRRFIAPNWSGDTKGFPASPVAALWELEIKWYKFTISGLVFCIFVAIAILVLTGNLLVPSGTRIPIFAICCLMVVIYLFLCLAFMPSEEHCEYVAKFKKQFIILKEHLFDRRTSYSGNLASFAKQAHLEIALQILRETAGSKSIVPQKEKVKLLQEGLFETTDILTEIGLISDKEKYLEMIWQEAQREAFHSDMAPA